jgi:hypothetical protein
MATEVEAVILGGSRCGLVLTRRSAGVALSWIPIFHFLNMYNCSVVKKIIKQINIVILVLRTPQHSISCNVCSKPVQRGERGR